MMQIDIMLITACICPSNEMINLTIVNSKDRLNEYIRTLDWVISETKINKIVFVDNSNYDLSIFDEHIMQAKYVGKEVEVLSFLGSDKANTKGKGFGEGELLEYAIRNSKIINSYRNCRIWKITGRLIVNNFNNIFENSIDRCIAILRMRWPLNDQIDTRFYMMDLEIYLRSFRKAYLSVDERDNYNLEHAFYNVVAKQKKLFIPFKRYPKIIGISGSTGKKYVEGNEIKIYDMLCRCGLYNKDIVYYLVGCLGKFHILSTKYIDRTE